jgi:hypothetical protein
MDIEGMPPPVDDRYRYWGEPPPEFSERLIFWLEYLAENTLTRAQLRSIGSDGHGYDSDAEEAGVYLWEWHHVLYHVIWNKVNERKPHQRLNVWTMSFEPYDPDAGRVE